LKSSHFFNLVADKRKGIINVTFDYKKHLESPANVWLKTRRKGWDGGGEERGRGGGRGRGQGDQGQEHLGKKMGDHLVETVLK